MIGGARLVGALALLWSCLASAGARAIVHPRAEAGSDGRAQYPVAVLALALVKAGYAHRLEPAPLAMPQSRSLRLLERSEMLDVVWSAATAERARQLRPVPFPIDRGLLGWRVLLVRNTALRRLREVRDLDGLRALRMGQGHDWPDVAVLRANGMDVVPGSDYEGLFRMLGAGRIDAFPRALSEVRAELAAHPGQGLAIEPGLLLHYPAALYFYLAPGDEELARALETGLERSHADGSLRALFDSHHGRDLVALAPSQRRLIELDPGPAAAHLPLQRRELWFAPGEE